MICSQHGTLHEAITVCGPCSRNTHALRVQEARAETMQWAIEKLRGEDADNEFSQAIDEGEYMGPATWAAWLKAEWEKENGE